jgi:hypothetical protein
MPLRIGVDVDGVLADFRSAFHNAARQCLRREIDEPEDPKGPQALLGKDVRRVWDWVAKRANWWMDLQAYEPDQIERLYAVTRAAGWEVYFLTNRPASGGDSVQFQTQWWIERHGFFLPAVLTVPGSRGDIANGLRLDLIIDDTSINCVEVVSASPAKALLMLRDANQAAEDHAISRGIGVVHSLAEAIVVLEQLHDLLPHRRGRLLRLADWFRLQADGETLPHNPRIIRPLPPDDGGELSGR